MTNQLFEAFRDPGHAFHVLRRKYLKISFSNEMFAHRSEYRSDSENGEYAAVVKMVLHNQKSFENFKRKSAYRDILENVGKDHGAGYLEIIRRRDDNMATMAQTTVFELDSVGNPIKFRYEGFSYPLSPTTLRYVKVASDLLGLFGRELERVAEIGCGYGGQTLANDKLLGYQHATLFDLPFVNELIKRYLNTMLLDGAYTVTTINETEPQKYDLVISNYAFSELPAVLQKTYITKVLSKSKRGYLTMNSGNGGDRDSGKLSLNELRELLPPFEVFEEEPITSPFNYIIAWGHDEDFARDNLKTKEV